METATKRKSNIELYRIVLMILIIAHHYVVNSGIMEVIHNEPTSLKSIYLLIIGGWGKIGIDCFILITGYFMCQSNISLKKYLKFILEFEFYRLLIYFILCISGNEVFEVITLLKLVLPIAVIGTNFASCYFVFYLFIPFINILIQNINKKVHLSLIVLLLFIYSILGTIPKINITMNYVTLFFIIYLIGAYIRLYTIKPLENKKTSILFSIITISLCICSIIIGAFIYKLTKINIIYYFVVDSNKILAVITSVSIFYLFKNMKIKYNPIINRIASSIFGVFLIHANSNAMRDFLWVKLLKVASIYEKTLPYIVLHSTCSVISIFAVCVIIDQIRINFIEKPLFKKISPKIDLIETKIIKKVGL